MTAPRFPESSYPPAPRYAGEYWPRVQRGYERAGAAAVFVCGLARDLGGRAGEALAALDAVAALFAASRAFVFENDSVDDTRAALAAWEARGGGRATRSEFRRRPKWGPVRSGLRGDQMAEYRNACRDAVLARPGGFDPDYVVVMDLDLAGYSTEGVASTLGADHWDAAGANGLAAHKGGVIQYDAWAWRDPGHPHPHPASEVNHRAYDRGHPPVPVDSCFGGMAVYRAAAFAASRYGGGDCEHAVFHHAMAGAGFGRVFMNPGMITLY